MAVCRDMEKMLTNKLLDQEEVSTVQTTLD